MSTHLIGWDATLEEQRVKFIYSADSSTGSWEYHKPSYWGRIISV